MSKWYKIAKSNYQSGKWTLAMLKAVLAKGRITQDEYNEIVGDSE